MFQLPAKEIRGSAVGSHPVLPHKKVVYFVGKNQFLEHNILRPQPLREINSGWGGRAKRTSRSPKEAGYSGPVISPRLARTR